MTEYHILNLGAGVQSTNWREILFSIPGAPRTKKTHNRLVRAGRRYRVLPSKPYEDWVRNTQGRALVIKSMLRDDYGLTIPLTDPVDVRAVFYRDRASGDECGYMQALGDWLEAVGIVANDRLIHWAGIRLTKDKDQPRVEVQLSL